MNTINNDRLISLNAAIDAADRADYTGLAVEDVKKVTDEVIKELKQLPSAQPKLYGYDIQHLIFVAEIMAKKGVTPEEAVNIFRDAKRMVDMVIDEMKETLVHEMKEMIEFYDKHH